MQTDSKNTESKSAEHSVNTNVPEYQLKYEKPVLVEYGDVRDVTLGPTPGSNESGCMSTRRVNPDVIGCP